MSNKVKDIDIKLNILLFLLILSKIIIIIIITEIISKKNIKK